MHDRDPSPLRPFPPRSDSASSFECDLELAARGDVEARGRIWSEHYGQVHALVLQWFDRRWRPGHGRGDLTIGATHIVNELFERLHDRSAAFEKGRAWFFQCFYTECRRIFLDHLRRRRRHHEGRVELPALAAGPVDDLDRIEVVLDQLESCDPLGVQIAWMKILEAVPDEAAPGAYRSLQNREIAARLGCSPSLVEKRWKFVKGHLLTRIRSIA